jgi:hypothetical protein
LDLPPEGALRQDRLSSCCACGRAAGSLSPRMSKLLAWPSDVRMLF